MEISAVLLILLIIGILNRSDDERLERIERMLEEKELENFDPRDNDYYG